MDDRTTTLVALGASVAANCRPCLEHYLNGAAEAGLDKEEIREAVAVGQQVARGAAAKMREFAAGALEESASREVPCSAAGCACR